MGYHVATIVQPGSNNTKILHSEIDSVRVCTVSLAASDDAGINVCPRAMPKSRINAMRKTGLSWEAIIGHATSRGLSMCSASCVTSESGHGHMDSVRNPRANLTRWYVENRAEFKAHLLDELWHEHSLLKAGQVLACRPNVNSDVPWHRTVPEMFDVPARYWDYTKDSKRLLQDLPDNYHLTYSVNDGTTPEDWQRVYDSGCNIAVVYDSEWQPGGKEQYRRFGMMPQWYTDPNGYRWRVIDGDVTDFRFLDPGPVCVGLRLKGFRFGKWMARISGFAVNLPRHLRDWYTDIHPAKAA